MTWCLRNPQAYLTLFTDLPVTIIIVTIVINGVVCSRWRWVLRRGGYLERSHPSSQFSTRGNWRATAATRLHSITATTTGRSHHCQSTKYVFTLFLLLFSIPAEREIVFSYATRSGFGDDFFVSVFAECDQKFVSTPEGPVNGTFHAPTLINTERSPRQCVYTFLAGPRQRVELIFTAFGLRGKPPEWVLSTYPVESYDLWSHISPICPPIAVFFALE